MNNEEIVNAIMSKLSVKNPKLKNNRELKNARIGKRAFVLATGPSIKQQDLSKLQGEDCFTISNFFLHKDIEKIKPIFHFFAPYHEPLEVNNFVEVWRMADEKLPSETNVVLGMASKNMVEKYNLFSKRKIYYIDLRGMKKVRTDLEKGIMAPQTGPIMMLPVLDYMGYKEINLIGCDMTMLKQYGGTVENFYEVDPRKHATDASSWSGIIEELRNQLKVMEQFQMYKDYFKKKKVSFRNLSKESWIDFIDKVDYNKVVEEINNL